MPLSSVEGRLWPDVGEVDITPALYAHEAEYAIPIADGVKRDVSEGVLVGGGCLG